jgi:hypothetical protein
VVLISIYLLLHARRRAAPQPEGFKPLRTTHPTFGSDKS